MPRCPYIKQQGVQVLTADYKTTDEAQKAIAENINKFYQEKYPQIASSKGGQHQGLQSPSCSASIAPRSSPT